MPSPSALLFVDTNIWLDFYRARTEAGLALLSHLDAIRDKIIMTYQVEMEFKKHRQDVILESFNAMKGPAHIPRPGLFSDAKSVKALHRDLKNAEKRVNYLRKRLKRAFEKPANSDPVYQVCQRCFHRVDQLTLTRESKIKHTIRRRAIHRFFNGCPPRKSGDTSIGDAINWEWIIHCAQNSQSAIHIVSRDSDYGALFDSSSYLNDHLLQEFKDRVSRRRKIVLHSKLADALKNFAVTVTPEEEQAEKEISEPTDPSPVARYKPMDSNILTVLEELLAMFPPKANQGDIAENTNPSQ